MWLPSFLVNFAFLPPALFDPHPVLAAGPTASDMWVILRLISIGLIFLRLVSRFFSWSSGSSAPAGSSFFWIRLLIVAVVACAAIGARIVYPPKSSQTASTSDQMRSVQTVVTAYMHSRASSPSSIQFLDWSDLESNGSDWLVTVHYKAMQRSGEWTTATVRFTVHGGTVTNAQVLRQS